MNTVRVFLGGEGNNELGSRGGHPAYQTDEQPGVVVALLRRVQSDGWMVVGALPWKRIPKLRARGPTPNEVQNVLGLVVDARRAQAEIVAFIRDGDDDRERPSVIAAGIDQARKDFPEVDVIGTTAVPVLEAWMLALLGKPKTEELRKSAAQARLIEHGVPPKNTPAMVRIVEEAKLDSLPRDAATLHAWLERAGDVLPRRVRDRSGSGG
jgi:hypothetical protein